MLQLQVTQRHVALTKKELIEEAQSFFRDNKKISLDPDLNLDGSLTRLIRHLNENVFSVDLTVETAKSQLRIRDNNVSTRFRLTVGLSPKGWVEHARLETAGHLLLRFPEVQVYMIPGVVGYRHLETFHRAFKRFFDCATPIQYRKKYKD